MPRRPGLLAVVQLGLVEQLEADRGPAGRGPATPPRPQARRRRSCRRPRSAWGRCRGRRRARRPGSQGQQAPFRAAEGVFGGRAVAHDHHRAGASATRAAAGCSVSRSPMTNPPPCSQTMAPGPGGGGRSAPPPPGRQPPCGPRSPCRWCPAPVPQHGRLQLGMAKRVGQVGREQRMNASSSGSMMTILTSRVRDPCRPSCWSLPLGHPPSVGHPTWITHRSSPILVAMGGPGPTAVAPGLAGRRARSGS